MNTRIPLRAAVAALLSGLFAVACVSAATVTINEAKEYQTIEGFGGFGGKILWWCIPWDTNDGRLMFDPAFMDNLIDSLGVSVIRDGVTPQFEDPNDNNDPNTWNAAAVQASITKRNYGYNFPQMKFPYIRALLAKGMTRYNVSVWSPPAWMKTGGGDCQDGPQQCGGTLIDSDQMRAEFAERAVQYCKLIKDSTGMDVYSFSIQNEPCFEEGYESCSYDGDHYVKLLKAVGQRFAAEGLKTYLNGPEDVVDLNPIGNAILADATARGYMHAFSVHGYGADGASPYSASAQMWQYHWAMAKTMCGQLWMTETEGSGGGAGTDWSFAWTHAQQLCSALRDGNVSLFTWWYMANQYYNNDNCTSVPTPTATWYTSRHYYRFIRPGAVRVDATSSDPTNVATVAFIHKQTTPPILTIELLNLNNAQATVNLSITGTAIPTQFRAFRSNTVDRCKDLGAVSGTSIQVPGQSIVTLCSEIPPLWPGRTAADPQQLRRSPPLARLNASAALYTVDGRSLARGDAATRAGAALRVCVAKSNDGTCALSRLTALR